MRSKKILKALGWIGLALGCLVFFTIVKFPTTKIQGWIDGEISSVLASQGIGFRATESDLSFLFGIKYTMKNVTLSPAAPAPIIRLDKIVIKPSLLPFLIGRTQIKVRIDQDKQELALKATLKTGQGFTVALDTDEADLGKMGLLAILAGVQGSVLISGQAEFQGNLESLSQVSGDVHLTIKKISLDPQSIKGFNVPKISIGSGEIQINAEAGKIKIKSLQLGKAGNAADDLILNASGDINLSKTLDNSNINLKTQFSLSPSVSKSFSLLDALLGAGKQADGSYKYLLSGPLTSPTPTPDT